MSMLARFATTGGGVATYIEDVFSTYLYTGNGSTQTITNGIDLSGKGGLVWTKGRAGTYGTASNRLFDTDRGANKPLSSNSTSGQGSTTQYLTSFNSTGFALGNDGEVNDSSTTYASWTFRKQPKFFDVVTYTGNGANRTIAHNLGSVPGCIIVKRTDTTADWQVYHRSIANTEYLVLNDTAAKATGTTRWNSTTPTATEFSLGTDTTVNVNGGTYVAYLFAHDAGGFGASGSDNVISCGSLTSGGTVNLGWEPQWVLCRWSNAASNWTLVDNMRGMPVGSSDAELYANLSNAETLNNVIEISSTGFTAPSAWWGSTNTIIYIAIRRGPMKTPTTGTSVYNAIARTGTGADATVTGVGFTPDLVHYKFRDSGSWNNCFEDRLRGATKQLYSDLTNAETTTTTAVTSFGMDGISVGNSLFINYSTGLYINHFFRRAPGFFDVVCYTGNATARSITHNLGVAPEFIIIKNRSATWDWQCRHSGFGVGQTSIQLNSTAAAGNLNLITSLGDASTFSINDNGQVNGNSNNLVAYLFATCPGVSKVFSYTGNGSSQTINCGFTGGARFVLIKRTDSTGDWYVWDSARGIVAGDDPHLSLNSTAAEVTTDDSVDTDSTGFVVNQLAATNVNVNTATYIGLAIA